MSDAQKFLITGASGQYARLALEGLQTKGIHPSSCVLVTRRPSDLEHYATQGATVRQGSFDDPLDELAAAFAGTDIMLLIATSKAGKRLPQHRRAIEAAQKAGVSHIVYTSFVGVDLLDHSALVVKEHRATEAMIRESGLRWTMLRDAQYAEAISDVAAPTALKHGKLQSNSADGRMAFVSRHDCVAAAVAVLHKPSEHRNKVYHITGPELLNWTDIARILSEVTGRDIPYEAMSEEEQFAIFDKMGVPREATDIVNPKHPWHSTDMVTFARAVKLGQMAFISDDVERLTGNKPRSLYEVIRERVVDAGTGLIVESQAINKSIHD